MATFLPKPVSQYQGVMQRLTFWQSNVTMM